MNLISLNQRISYLPAKENPLSADVGIIQGDTKTWFFDVGNNEEAYNYIMEQKREKAFIISHFHPDHMGNLNRIAYKNDTDALELKEGCQLYVGDNTHKYTKIGETVTSDIYIEDGCKIHIFPLPSSHARGCLGLEIDDEFVFIGDAAYSTKKNGHTVYNVQFLEAEIRVLSSLNAKYVLQSHMAPMERPLAGLLERLKTIYAMRKKGESFITLESNII